MTNREVQQKLIVICVGVMLFVATATVLFYSFRANKSRR